MNHQSAVFDKCRTKDEINAQLQNLAKELLETIRRQSSADTPVVERSESPGVSESIDLRVLSELSYGELKFYDHPVFLLSEICRLLFKLGDKESLTLCLALSHKIYPFKCKHNESWYISYLYKGIAQIGSSMTDLGIKNVLTGIAEQRDFSIMPVDRALGYWALMSAAITNKNLKLASAFTEKWQHTAKEGRLEGEMFRSHMVMALMNILLGEQEICAQTIEELLASPPEEWKAAADFLAGWAKALCEGKYMGIGTFSEPYPLFLGFDWHSFGKQPGAFSNLCGVRQRCCRKNVVEMLPTKEIKQYADLMAQWELPGPLCEFETILKEREHEEYVHCNLTRLLGEEVLDKVFSETPQDPDVVMRDEAIILLTDVRRFSAITEDRTPKGIFKMLNPIFKIMHEELEPIGGTLLEFVGDSIIVVFNTFKNLQSDMLNILSHTIRCLERIRVLDALSAQTGSPEIRIGVGIHKGPIALGYLGGLKRCHLTVLGNTINLAARLEAATKDLPGDVIVSEACFDGDASDIWSDPCQINFSLRDLGKHVMKNIRKPVHLFGLKPLLQYWVDFIPMGFVAHPEKGVIYIDTGNSAEPGIIDLDFGEQHSYSSCELLNKKPELLLGHIQGTPHSQIEFRLHNSPDMDCAATLYTAQEFMEEHPRKELLKRLAAYVSSFNQGNVPQPETLSDSLYGLFSAHQKIVKQQHGGELTDFLLLEAGMRVIDAAVYAMEENRFGDFSNIFQLHPGWFPEERELIRKDNKMYQEDVKERSHMYTARIKESSEPVTGLWLDHPHSVFFKVWAKDDPNAPGSNGYHFLTLDLSQTGKNRFIIFSYADREPNLGGLGKLLEKHEKRKRKELGQERPVHPIRPPSDNSDPWYFGQGHDYTILDAPWGGTILTAEEVQEIHESWEE